jgi:hypothetical protein
MADKAEKKDAGVAALISALGLLILSAPALGYFYLGNMKKGIIYLLAVWVLAGILAVLYLVGGIATGGIGFLCLLPIFFLILLFEFVIIYDVYLMAKGEQPKLPSF